MPAATRIGDADVPHCSGMVRAQGSDNVFVNYIPWSREETTTPLTCYLVTLAPYTLPLLPNWLCLRLL